MDKSRAIVIYATTLLKEREGEGELINCPKHSYWEAQKLINKNGWKEEAYDYLQELIEEERKKIEPVKEEYYEYLTSEEKDDKWEDILREKLQKFNINGEAEETVKFRVEHGRNPESSELEEILKKRKAEDYATAKVFYDIQVQIYFGKDFDKEKLLEATKKLKDRGLYKIALKNIPFAITHQKAKDWNVWKEDKDPEYFLY